VCFSGRFLLEALNAFQRAIELHDQDKSPHATTSLKQDALLFIARLGKPESGGGVCVGGGGRAFYYTYIYSGKR